MSAEKRPATDGFGSTQMVKRQKSDNNLSSSVAVVNGGGQNGALVQSVCPAPDSVNAESIEGAKTGFGRGDNG